MAQRTCVTPGCGGVTGISGTALGLCHKCYYRWHKYGDVTVTARIIGDDEARFWAKVNKRGPNDCWPWKAGKDSNGYGTFSYTPVDGHAIGARAHRWLIGHLRGEHLGPDEETCHTCDNPPCVNPAHLYIGTHTTNMQDAVARMRLWQLKVTHCPQGHPMDGVTTRKGTPRRYCKTCDKERQHQRKTLDRTTCKNGHPIEGDNILLCKNGTRKCRVCDAERRALSSSRNRERKAA
jgi:hypothetical protein